MGFLSVDDPKNLGIKPWVNGKLCQCCWPDGQCWDLYVSYLKWFSSD